MLSIAFKEWAVICRALVEGRQTIILRKGGIAESGGEFRPEHPRFLLFPTYFHERHRTSIRADWLALFDEVEAHPPLPGLIRFAAWAEVAAVAHLTSDTQLSQLEDLHGWTPAEVRKRFEYRSPGLYGLAVRVWRLPQVVEIPEQPEYAGCKTWVELDSPISTDGATPVLSDEAFADVLRAVESLRD